MIRTIVLLAVFLASVSAFNRMQMTMKNEALQSKIAKALGVGAMAFALSGPSMPVLADGAYSASSVYRTRNFYGARISGYEKDVNAANFAGLSDKTVSNSFDLFISGTTKGKKDLAAKETAAANAFKAAVSAKDAGKLKAAYSDFIKIASLKSDYKPGELGQSDSSGYAPTWGTEKQYIYQR